MAFTTPQSSAGEVDIRVNLPGIPSHVGRVSAERIWKTNCASELDYLRRRNRNPPKYRHSCGTLHGFEIVKHPTYVSVQRIRSPTSSAVGSQTSTLFGSLETQQMSTSPPM